MSRPEDTSVGGISLLPWQARLLLLPEELDLLLAGGRGGGKTFAVLIAILRHAVQYGSAARVLVLRRTYKALEDLMATALEVFTTAYGKAARFNFAERFVKIHGGAYVEFGQLETQADLTKYVGRSFSLLVVDEVGQYPDPRLLETVRGSLRARRGIPCRTLWTANPGGVGHGWLCARFIFSGAEPWKPFTDEATGRQWVVCPSWFEENSYIDPVAYEAQLRAACAHDAGLFESWVTGNWAAASAGAFFGDVLQESRVAFGPWQPAEWPELDRQGWRLSLAHDFGSSAPSVTYVVAESPGATGPDGEFYPRDSVLLLDELASSDPSNPAQGLGWTVDRLAGEIVKLCERWGIEPEGVADDACFAKHGHSSGSIADEFQRYGVSFDPAEKGSRLSGWQKMRTLLANAGEPDVPGLYISRACPYWWTTVPSLPRCPRNPEDLDSRSIDHAADACRYALTREAHEVGTVDWY